MNTKPLRRIIFVMNGPGNIRPVLVLSQGFYFVCVKGDFLT
jgi:hypothetical protein